MKSNKNIVNAIIPLSMIKKGLNIMITTTNIRMEKSETKFYAPPYFANNICKLLKQNGITFMYQTWDIASDNKQTRNEKQNWATRFATLQRDDTRHVWADANFMDCITSHCNTNDLFAIATQMTGSNADIDFKKMETIIAKQCLEDYERNYEQHNN